jgi:hypothetical protein
MRRLVLIAFIAVIAVVFVTAWRDEHRRHPVNDGCPVATTAPPPGAIDSKCFLNGP